MNKIEQLQAQIADANQQITTAEATIAAEQQKGSEANAGIIQQAQELIAALREDVDRQLRQIAEIEREERTQVQESVMALPYDFNDVFGNATANDTIRELINLASQKTADYYDKLIAKICADYDEQLRGAAERELQLQRQNRELQHDLEQWDKENVEYLRELAEAIAERDEARKNRDNAANELEAERAENARLNAHIDDLRQQLANAPAPKAAIEIGGSSKLDELVTQAKAAKESPAEKANRGLLRWGMEPLNLPDMPPVTPPVTPEGAFQSDDTTPDDQDNRIPTTPPTAVGEQFREESPVQGHPANGEMETEGLGQVRAGVVSREEFTALERRVTAIERHANLPGVA